MVVVIKNLPSYEALEGPTVPGLNPSQAARRLTLHYTGPPYEPRMKPRMLGKSYKASAIKVLIM